MWLVEAGDVRVLFDPLIDGVHHGGVFEVEPRREIDVAALRPDFIVVSHQHSDHFDLPSLYALAKRDPDAVVMTADALVASTARRLGFRTVATVETFSRIDLAGVRMASTPSFTDEIEWGMLVESTEGVVWNQIDSYHPDPSQVRTTLESASKIFGRDLTTDLALALVRWQPVLETAGPLSERTGFPYLEYAMSLGRIAMTEARAVVPSAAGVRQTAPYGWMNHYVYPVPAARIARDLALRAPKMQAFPATIGATYRVRGGQPSYEPGGARHLVKVDELDIDPANTLFKPFEMPPLRDPNARGHDEEEMRRRVSRWVREDLAAGISRAYPGMGVTGSLRFVAEVVFPRATDAYCITVDASGHTVSTRFDDDYDALNSIAGSMLYEVIEGRRQWGDPLLGGMLRSVRRAYDINEQGLAIANVSATFLYYGLGYGESVRRAVEWQIHELTGG